MGNIFISAAKHSSSFILFFAFLLLLHPANLNIVALSFLLFDSGTPGKWVILIAHELRRSCCVACAWQITGDYTQSLELNQTFQSLRKASVLNQAEG